jgi:hypothetical protein
MQNEFKAMNYMNDVCYNIRQIDKNFRIKVPLACIIEYLGFKALVIAKPPTNYDDSTLAQGPVALDGSFRQAIKLEKEINMLGRALAIRPHHFVWNEMETITRKFAIL